MQKEKILVIDDERDMLSGCQKFLETEGYAVAVAESGEVGLALFETETPDLVIVDLNMPGIDGMAVLQSIMARDQQEAKDAVIEKFEQTFIDRLLKAHNGNVSRAARQNGTERRTLQRLISKYAIDVSTYR